MAMVQPDHDFDEEEAERDAEEIERLVREFVDEDSMRHNVIPESDSEAEEDEVPVRRREGSSRRGDGNLYFGQRFFNGVSFKEAVLDYVLRTGVNLRQYRHDGDKIGYKCMGGKSDDAEGEGERCSWQVYASILPKDGVWKVRVFVDNHTCVPNGECEMFKVPVILRLFLDKIRHEPDYYKPMKIEEIIRERWHITVSRPQCQSARNKALRWIECEYDHQFKRIRDYAEELRNSNENSTVVIETITNAEGLEEFNRFYVCFDVIKRTWKSSCRRIIGVDGTFLKTKMKGQLLAAIGRDADNRIYPIAWGVVQVENIPNWLWFVQMLKSDLDLKDGDGYILISDRQKGLIKAVEMEIPRIEHRMCVRHIYANVKKNHAKKDRLKLLLWLLAWSYNEAEYGERLEKIYCYDTAIYNDVMKTNPKSWCRAFYRLGNYCEDVENNFTESYNNTVSKAREMPFVPMLETIRRLAMTRIAKRSAKSHNHKGIVTPYVTEFLAMEKEDAGHCRVTRSTNGMYEATLYGCSYRVSLEKMICSCKKWQICGIPCEHAYGVMIEKKLIPENYVCARFKTAMWRSNYVDGLVPVRGARFWPKTNEPDVHVPPEPLQLGRKKVTKADKKRKKGKHESPTKKQPKEKKRIMHCRVCGSANHNSRFHKKDAPKTTNGEGDNPQVSQVSQASQAE